VVEPKPAAGVSEQLQLAGRPFQSPRDRDPQSDPRHEPAAANRLGLAGARPLVDGQDGRRGFLDPLRRLIQIDLPEPEI
jgi:hypothetical protein